MIWEQHQTLMDKPTRLEFSAAHVVSVTPETISSNSMGLKGISLWLGYFPGQYRSSVTCPSQPSLSPA